MSAIGIKIHKPKGEYDLGASKFFGAPVLPERWLDRFSDDVIFFAQIRLTDIAHLDTENRLPHTGYLYFFLAADTGFLDNIDGYAYFFFEKDRSNIDGIRLVIDRS